LENHVAINNTLSGSSLREGKELLFHAYDYEKVEKQQELYVRCKELD
jgi:hypothetical protein